MRATQQQEFRTKSQVKSRTTCALFLMSVLFCGALPSCNLARKSEKAQPNQNFGHKQPGLASFKKMGLYRAGKQYCQNEPEFHLKKEEDHNPWSNIYGWVCTDPARGLVEVHEGDDNIFATGVLKDPEKTNGTSNVEIQLGASYDIRDGQNIVVAHLNEDQNWTLKNLVQKSFRITNRSTALLGTSTKLPFTFLYTSFAINSPSGTPLAKIWSHFWNWTVEDLQDDKVGEADKFALRRVLYVIPMIFELKNGMDAARHKINPASSTSEGSSRNYDDPAVPQGFDPYANPASGAASAGEFGAPSNGN